MTGRFNQVLAWTTVVVLTLALAFGERSVSAAQGPQSVQIQLPTIITFFVSDVNGTTVGSPQPTRIGFRNARLRNNRSFRISLRAANDFRLGGRGRGAFPASNVSWKVSSVVNGFGSNGTLDRGAFTQVFESLPNATSGGVDVSWELSAPGTSILAGTYSLRARWRLESIRP